MVSSSSALCHTLGAPFSKHVDQTQLGAGGGRDAGVLRGLPKVMALKVLPREHHLQACEGSEFSGFSLDSLDQEHPWAVRGGGGPGHPPCGWMEFALESDHVASWESFLTAPPPPHL